MSDEDRTRWNERYAAGAYGARMNPCALLETMLADWAPDQSQALPQTSTPGGTEVLGLRRALDLACGAGRNAVYLASKGFAVDALDISAQALARGARRAEEARVHVNWEEQDLDEPLPATLSSGQRLGPYALIVVVRYADLELVKRLPALLQPGGRLLVEAHLGGPLFTDERDASGDRLIGGPGSEWFRLKPGSLAAACAGLTVVHSREAQIADPDGRLMALAQFVGEALKP